jgi:hypothetical protein
MKASSTFKAQALRKLITLVAMAAAICQFPCAYSAAPVAQPASKAPGPASQPLSSSELNRYRMTPGEKGAEKQASKTSKSTAVKAPVAKSTAAKPRKMMVPPPPPEIPLVMGRDSIEFSTAGLPLDLMSTADLQRVKSRLEQSLSQLTKKADERNAELNDARTRVQQFEGLFTEGVVSKRDLTNARKELASIEGTDSDIDVRISDVKSDLARVEKRLKSVAAKKVPAQQVRSKHI